LVVIVNLGHNIGSHTKPFLPVGWILQKSGTMNNHTFRVGPLVNLASLVDSLGFDPEPIFIESGLDQKDFRDPDHRMPYLSSSRLLANCVEATGCDHIGLLLGIRAEPSHLGVVGFLVRAAPTVEVALQALVENLDLHEDSASVRLNIGPEYSSLNYNVHEPGILAIEQIGDLSAVMMYKILATLCCKDWAASTVKLIRREPEDWGPYRRFFRSALFFNSTECTITFNNHCLGQKPPTADQLLYKYLRKEARQLHDLHHNELMEELPAAMMQGLLTEKFSARHIADTFGMRERTLHRRLRVAGTSFRQELDAARKLVSEQLLGGTSLPVCDVASALGYADASGFIRAFQRWAGTSPSTWRKKNGLHSQNGARSGMSG